jgi:hypothetical protein
MGSISLPFKSWRRFVTDSTNEVWLKWCSVFSKARHKMDAFSTYAFFLWECLLLNEEALTSPQGKKNSWRGNEA